MPPDISYRPIQAHECEKVADLHKRTFPPDAVKRTIYASTRISRYLQNLVSYPDLQGDHFLLGAWHDRNLVGYAHFRALPASWHLNYIAVLPAYQGRGVGHELWKRFVEAGKQRGCGRLSLDVEHDNLRALDWYRRRHMAVVATTRTYETFLEPSGESPAGAVKLLDWEAAEAWQASYGFSRFQLLCRGKTWSIGRIGDSYFRASEALQPVLESALAAIDAGRCLLVATPEELKEQRFREVEVALRMEGEVI
ncbi:MAG: GNAT family N-acetyltransferase [Chloroflexota bacterium]|nr:GNAT family N-acetyltransferase [Chloroflexota bacterium]